MRKCLGTTVAIWDCLALERIAATKNHGKRSSQRGLPEAVGSVDLWPPFEVDARRLWRRRFFGIARIKKPQESSRPLGRAAFFLAAGIG